MKLTLRKLLFWPHFVAGLLAGIVIALLSLTGVLLVFEKPVVRWADTERVVQVPAGAVRLSADELLARANAARPGKSATALVVSAEPTEVALVNFGREDGVYVDPYTGEVRALGGVKARDFFHDVTDLHRFLLGHGERRALGKGITGAANLIFLFLGLTGLYLWFPRKWAWRAYRPAMWFRQGLKGKARDFSWHNVIGFWCLPVLLVLTASGAVISYKWASDFVYRAMGHEPPAQGGPGAAPVAKVSVPAEGAQPGTLQAHFDAAAAAVPNFESITWRAPQGRPTGASASAAPRQPSGGEGSGAMPAMATPGAQVQRADASGTASAQAAEPQRSGATAQPPSGETPRADATATASGGSVEGKRSGGTIAPQSVALSVRLKDAPPQSATVQLAIDPYSSAILTREGYAEANSGRKVRMWLRFLHTGEALGPVGQAVAALASLGALFLVYTGIALALRRMFPRKRRATASEQLPAQTEPSAS